MSLGHIENTRAANIIKISYFIKTYQVEKMKLNKEIIRCLIYKMKELQKILHLKN